MDLHEQLQQWLAQREGAKALLCDIDETLCTSFDIPIHEAIEVLRQLSPKVPVHYVTARPPQTEAATTRFLEEHDLPTPQHLWLCPSHKSSFRHKLEAFEQLSREAEILLSIGDTFEEEGKASKLLDIPFALVCRRDPQQSWREIRGLLADWLGPES